MNPHELHLLGIAEASALIAARRISPVEYVDVLLAHTDRLDPILNTYLTRTPERARKEARQAEREIAAGKSRGPLHGIPFALKDVIDVAGLPTTCNSRLRGQQVSGADALVARRLRAAGMVLLGKLALHEFAHGGPSFDLPWPPVRNPWDLNRVPGGSSSGCGAAIAAGLVPAAIGTDTGGSIRIPASFCGITGLMPTAGLIGRSGVVPHSQTFDRCGPMAASAEDCAMLMQALVGFDAGDTGSVRHAVPDYHAALRGSLTGLRIGVLRHTWEEDTPASADLQRAMDDALRILGGLGATLTPCRVRPLRDFNDVKVILAESEIINIHLHDLRCRASEFGADIRTRMLPALLFTAQDYVSAARQHRRLVIETLALHERFDVFIMAGQGEAPHFAAHRSLNFWQRPNAFTLPNITGQPALAVPIGFGENGLPLGMQILGRPFEDATVLKVGHAFQQESAWHLKRAPRADSLPVPPLYAPAPQPKAIDDTDMRVSDLCRQALTSAGLQLDAFMFQQMLEGAPDALAMRLRQQTRHGDADPPSLVFHPQRPAGRAVATQIARQSSAPRLPD